MPSNPALTGLNVKGTEGVKDLTELRADIDQIDARIIELLGLRYAYTPIAARFKHNSGKGVRDESRFAFQIKRAGDIGEQHGVPRFLAEQLWKRMIELHVEVEEQEWAKANTDKAPR